MRNDASVSHSIDHSLALDGNGTDGILARNACEFSSGPCGIVRLDVAGMPAPLSGAAKVALRGCWESCFELRNVIVEPVASRGSKQS